MLFVCDKGRKPGTVSAGSRRFNRIQVRATTCLLVMSMLVAVPALAQNDVTDGKFYIRDASTGTTDEVLYLNAEINYSLTPGAIEALNSGVPLTFETQIELERVRRFLPDPNVVSLVQRSQLNYHALTQRFVVKNLNSSEQSSYGTLSEALTKIGRHEEYPVIDISLLDQNATYAIKVHSVLDTRSFPAPLRLLAALFRIDDWRLESEWKRWLVTL